MSLPSPASRKEVTKLMSFSRQFIQELHKCVGKRIMPRPLLAIPLYPLQSTAPHPSPRRHSSLAQDYIRHIIWSLVHLRNAAQGTWLSWGIWGSQVPVIRLGSSPRRHRGAAATPTPHKPKSIAYLVYNQQCKKFNKQEDLNWDVSILLRSGAKKKIIEGR